AGSAVTAGAANSVAAGNISGTIGLAQLPGAVVTNGASGVNLAGAFSGNGAGVTNIQLSAIGAPGTLSLATGFFSLMTNLTTGASPNHVVAADVNGDGRL